MATWPRNVLQSIDAIAAILNALLLLVRSHAAVLLRENDPMKPALSVERHHYRGDPNLIQLDIQIVRSVKRSA